MKISFDLDDTAWKYRAVFAAMAHAFKAAGHEIGIITGHGDYLREDDLKLWVARGFPPADFLLNASDCERENIPWHGVPQRIPKLELMRRHGVTVHFDDFGCRHDFEIECVVLDQPDQSKE
jgi:hypothetical protein